MNDDEYEKLRRELVFEQVSKAIKEDPQNWRSQLEDLGFQWFDDEFDQEEIEEDLARPENPNQELLVAYLEGFVALSYQVLDAYLAEKDSPAPNYPLIRKYFKSGNENLKRLLMFGIDENPTDIGLLSDLGFYSEFRNVLSDLIQVYLNACRQEQDLTKFEELVLNFTCDVEPHGFDALSELEQQFSFDSEKGKILKNIRQSQELESESVSF